MALKKYTSDEEKRRAHVADSAKYNAANYVSIVLHIRPTQRDLIEKMAAAANQSKTAYIMQAVEERAARDGEEKTR